jgi:hypothetical protein
MKSNSAKFMQRLRPRLNCTGKFFKLSFAHEKSCFSSLVLLYWRVKTATETMKKKIVVLGLFNAGTDDNEP